MGDVNLWGLVIEMGVLAFFGFLFYLFQKRRILRNSDLDLIKDILNYFHKHELHQEFREELIKTELNRETLELYVTKLTDKIQELPSSYQERWHACFEFQNNDN